MILDNTEGQGYVAYSPAYVSMAYKLPTRQSYLTEGWLKDLNRDVVETIKRMMIPERIFVQGLQGSMKHQAFVLHTG